MAIADSFKGTGHSLGVSAASNDSSDTEKDKKDEEVK